MPPIDTNDLLGKDSLSCKTFSRQKKAGFGGKIKNIFFKKKRKRRRAKEQKEQDIVDKKPSQHKSRIKVMSVHVTSTH